MKSYLKYLSALLLMIGLFGCGGSVKNGVINGELTDPLLIWNAVTTDCIGGPMTGIRYNVYAISGNGPIPTTPSADSEPCGIVQIASIPPLNTALINGTSYQAFVPDGIWTFAVEAVGVNGAKSGLSNQITVTVLGRPAGVINLTIGKLGFILLPPIEDKK